MKKALFTIGSLILLSVVAYVMVVYWSVIFSRNVEGVISDVQRVAPPAVLVGGASATSKEMFSYAVAIKTPDNEIVTASAEDRQWAVAKAGQCVKAKFFPYPPWNFEKAGTYYGARLVRLYVCDGENAEQPKNE